MKITRKELLRRLGLGALFAGLVSSITRKAAAKSIGPIKPMPVENLKFTIEKPIGGITVERNMVLSHKPRFRLYFEVRFEDPREISAVLFFWGHVNATRFYDCAPGELLFEAFRARRISHKGCLMQCCFAGLDEAHRDWYSPADLNLAFEGMDVKYVAHCMPDWWPVGEKPWWPVIEEGENGC